MSEIKIEGRTALVTGAGSGLGEATAVALARAGARVACCDVDLRGAERVAEELGQAGGQSLAVGCDVSDESSVCKAVEKTAAYFGGVDIAVNNAAIDHTVSIADMTVCQWDQVIAVNLRGPFLVSKAVLPYMNSQEYGHIVNIASTAATRAWANAAAYHATKWGLVGFGRALGVEGREHGVRVTTIIPGGMDTHFFDRFESQGIPMPDPDTLQSPASVADLIVWALCAPAGSVLQEAMITPLMETSWP